MKRFLKILSVVLLIGLLAGYLILSQIVWPRVDADMNAVTARGTHDITEAAQELHDALWVADLHADNLLWRRDPAKRHDYGHVDLPRLVEGGVEFQIFSAVTKSPEGLNFDGNDADAPDQITKLAQAQLWPPRTWGSIYERATYQAQRLQKLERAGRVHIVRSRADMAKTDRLLGLLLTEGSHPLEGDLDNIARLHAEGYHAIIDAVTLLGVEAVALGSDFDGTVTTSLDSSELAAITDALMQRGLSDAHIRAVMGENARRFFTENLPAE